MLTCFSAFANVFGLLQSKHLKEEFSKVVTEYENRELTIEVIADISMSDDQVMSEEEGDSSVDTDTISIVGKLSIEQPFL